MDRMGMKAEDRVRLARENMNAVLAAKYGPDFWNLMINDRIPNHLK
jgi:hypothetical protein